MHPFPHRYQIRIAARPEGALGLNAEGVAEIQSMPPPEFDGPGGYWAPETLLLAAIGDCTMLTFRAIAKASRFEWLELSAEVHGLLERIDGNSRFTRIETRVRLVLPAGSDAAKAKKLMEKAEQGCPISNSLKAERHLECEVVEEA